MGFTIIFPISMLMAHLTIRFASAGWRPKAIRSDIWTTILITVVGDVFLELLLPSLQCLPQPQASSAEMDLGGSIFGGIYLYWTWLQQAWGFNCPSNSNIDPQQLLSPDAVGTLLTIRHIFMCWGVYLGESFVPIVLTGGIACGKTTVAQMLVDPKQRAGSTDGGSNNKQSGGNRQKKRKAKPSSLQSDGGFGGSSKSNNSSAEEEEGTFFLVDTDSIGHEILLPPAILAGQDVADGKNMPLQQQIYTVHPNDSVYNDILQAFGDKSIDNRNILDEYGLIERRRVGAIIFQDPSKRRVLNKITHPRILYILFKRILFGVFWSNQDIVCADIPLLFESGQLRSLFALTIVVACSPGIQLQRLQVRNPDLSEQECKDRIASQIPVADKAKKADIVIWNNGDMEALSAQVEEVRRDVMGRLYGIGMSLLQMLVLVGGSLSLAVSCKLFSWQNL